MNASDILIEFNDDGDCRISFPDPSAPLFPRKSFPLPADLAEILIDVPALKAKGVQFENANQSHEVAQRQHAAQMQRAGDRSNDAFMLAGRR